MSEQEPPKQKGTTNPFRPDGLGSDAQSGSLQGIAPAVVEAFLNTGGSKKKKDPNKGLFTAPLPPSPEEATVTLPNARLPEHLGLFAARPESSSVQQRAMKIKHLAMMARKATPPPPASPAPPKPTGDLDPGHVKLQHLAMRAKQKTGDGPPSKRLEQMVGDALGGDSILRLRKSLEALDDKAIPSKLQRLTEQVNQLVPGSDGVIKVGAQMGKKMIVDNINPILALSLAAKESAERINNLKHWEEMTSKERVANMVLLSSSLAEIMGAVTPPPVNFGAQVMGAGLALVGLATENSATVEAQARGDGPSRLANRGNGASLATNVKNAWGELGGRLEGLKALKGRPKVPKWVQLILDSPGFKRLKNHPVSRGVAVGFENLVYNLSRRFSHMQARWLHRLGEIFRRG